MLLQILLIASLCYLGLILFALLRSPRMIFPMPPSSYQPHPDIQTLTLASGEKIAFRHYPNPQAQYTLLYHHGNGEDIGNMHTFFEQYVEQGYALLAFDYPGYGLSSGRANENNCHASAQAMLDWLQSEQQLPLNRILLCGRSLGGGPAIHLATQHPVAGLITECTFSSTFRVITRRKILPWDTFDNLARLPHIQCPILIIHGKKDPVVPFSHGLALAKKAPLPPHTLWLEEADHNNIIERYPQEYWGSLQQFTQSLS